MRIIFLEPSEASSNKVLRRTATFDESVQSKVAEIIATVREQGDKALLDYTAEFDGVKLAGVRLPDELIALAHRRANFQVIDTLEAAATNIKAFHEKNKAESFFEARPNGSIVGTRITPIDSVGMYVPGGRAPYPSTVLMNAIPAHVAGVRRIVMVTPPRKDGSIDPVILTAAKIAGVHEVYAIGGAQAIAALAYGTESIEAVDKITGPGNAYVAAAKRQVAGDVGIDMIAGPSEVLILADETSEPSLIAIDLMAQAEHDPEAVCYLVTTDESLAQEVLNEIDAFLPDSPRAEITKESLDSNGVIFVAPDMETALYTVNAIAPEHLEIHADNAFGLLGRINNAGAIFLGAWTPESVGDYVAGPNHTLPTSGTARFSSPLSVEDFQKRSSIISYTPASLRDDAETIEGMAAFEGLWAHGKAVRARFELFESDDA